ncbi:MAG: Sec-independent protein translocase protein TatB [Proteobacteria bacterium]|nr:Sec-independent protein translocase protein TatB [Pseudomonadota bacterium]
MFDVGWSELLVVGVVALIVIPPKDLPGTFRTVGKAVGRLRQMASDFRGQFDDAMREAEIHEMKKSFSDMESAAKSATEGMNDPLATIRDDLTKTAEEQSGAKMLSENLSAIEADAKALEIEAAKPSPAPVEGSSAEGSPAKGNAA